MSNYIRKANKDLSLSVLRDSPAWDLFFQTFVEVFSFLQDDIVFKMNGISEMQEIYKEWILEGYNPYSAVVEEGDLYKVQIDTRPVDVYCNCGVLSLDGLSFSKYAKIDDQPFWIKFTKTEAKSNIRLMPKKFYPNHPLYKSFFDVIDIYGLYEDKVKDSDFFMYKSATSIYMIDFFLKKSKVGYTFDYFFKDKKDEFSEIKGAKEYLVRDSLELVKVGDFEYRYNTTLMLVANKDYIVLPDGTRSLITSVGTHTLTLERYVPDGVVSVFKSDYWVGVDQNSTLLSAVEIEYSSEHTEFMDRFLPRVLPVRCTEGYKGSVDIRIHTKSKLLDEFLLGNLYHSDVLRINDMISWLENQILFVESSMVLQGDKKVYAAATTNREFNEIVLI